MYRLAANLEWLFTEAGEATGDRARTAAAHGFDAVEIWEWRNKDLGELQQALEDTDVQLLSLIVDPKLDLTDPTSHEAYLRGVEESIPVAQRLGSPNLVAVAGAEQPNVSRTAQHAAVVSALSRATDLLEGTGVRLILEPLNTRVDHIGEYLNSTAEGLEIVREVGRPELRLLFDAYHALMMGEDIEAELDGSIDLVGHVQIADIPGRNQPGSGAVDWARELDTLYRVGYRGAIGLEYKPTVDTPASLDHIERINRRHASERNAERAIPSPDVTLHQSK